MSLVVGESVNGHSGCRGVQAMLTIIELIFTKSASVFVCTNLQIIYAASCPLQDKKACLLPTCSGFDGDL